MPSPTLPGQHPLTYSGSIDRSARVFVYSHPEGAACGATVAAEQAIAGSQQQGNVAVATGSFNSQMQVGWTTKATYRVCGYLYTDDHPGQGDAPASTSAIVVVVGDAPAATGSVSLTLDRRRIYDRPGADHDRWLEQRGGHRTGLGATGERALWIKLQ